MKKIVMYVLLTAMVLSASACGANKEPSETENAPAAEAVEEETIEETEMPDITEEPEVSVAEESVDTIEQAEVAAEEESAEPEGEYADVTITYVNESDVDLSKVNIFYLGGHSNIEFGSIPAGESSSVVLNIPLGEEHLLDAEYYCGDQMLSYWAVPIPSMQKEI